MAERSKAERMRRLREEVEGCRRCGLCDGRRRPVLGEGSLSPAAMLIGEAPGRREDETGRPFVGAAGQLLGRLLARIGLERGDVYITNIVKCRPPNNRPPRAEEVEACAPHLEAQLAIIEPRVISPMGNTALSYLAGGFGLTSAVIGAAHGRAFEAEAPWGRIVLFPLYHPAAALYDVGLVGVMEEDFDALGRALDGLGVPRRGGP